MNNNSVLAIAARQTRWNRQDQVFKLEDIRSEMAANQKSQRQLFLLLRTFWITITSSNLVKRQSK